MLGAVRITPESLEGVIVRIAGKYGVDPNHVKAIIKQESGWDANASRYEAHLNDTSWGLMQVLLKTAKATLGNDKLTISDLLNPEINIETGTKFIASLLNRYGNFDDATAAYNAGSPRRAADKKYVNQKYVDSVNNYYSMYKTLGPLATVIVSESKSTIMYVIMAAAVVGGFVLMQSPSRK